MTIQNHLPFFLIDLMKSVIKGEGLLSEKTNELIFQLEQCEPTPETEYMLDTAKWLQKEIINH